MERQRTDRGGFDAGTYGRSFADVYDEWYGDRDASTLVRVVSDALAGRSGGTAAATVLELGAGTGRVSIPLRDAGFVVTALDSSTEMLDILARRASSRITCRHGDAADVSTYPTGPFDAVVAAFNLICNLEDRAAQGRCLRAMANRLAPGGVAVVEAFVPAPPERRSVDVTTSRVESARMVLIATDTDPTTSTVRGAHLEFIDGATRVRPWRLCYLDPAELDALAVDAGLTLVARLDAATGEAFRPAEHVEHCSIYRRTTA